MSLSNALSNAVSGLVAASRGTEVVASNLANALTPGFARREMQLSQRPHLSSGGGVHVDGVARVVRTNVLAQTRTASSETARADTLATFHSAMSASIGVPGEAGALATLLANFDAALVGAAARPENEASLSRVVTTATSLTKAFNRMGTEIQAARTTADRAIAADVDALNAGLARVVELNRQITVQLATGEDANASLDARQKVIDAISQIVPVQEVQRENGRVAIFTMSGGVLLDGAKPMRIGFQPAGTITPQMQAGSFPLGNVSVEDVETTTAQTGFFAGGRLAANMQIRDHDAPAAQARLDAAGRDLYDRMSASAVDDTLGGTLPGLFTDAGGLTVSGNGAGFAQRMAVNSAVDPSQGGALWRLRDGIGATTAGPVGGSARLDRMRLSLSDARLPQSSGISAVSRTATSMIADVTSAAASDRLGAEAVQTAARSQISTFETMMRQDGVDSDKEMETLLALERAYASNAKVLQAVDDMIQTILRMT